MVTASVARLRQHSALVIQQEPNGLYGPPAGRDAKERLAGLTIDPVGISFSHWEGGAQICFRYIAVISVVVFVVGELCPGNDVCHVASTERLEESHNNIDDSAARFVEDHPPNGAHSIAAAR